MATKPITAPSASRKRCNEGGRPDPIFALIERYRAAGTKIDRTCEKRDEIEARYPLRWFDCAFVEVGMFDPCGGQRKRPILARSHEEIDEKRQAEWDMFNSLGLDHGAQWQKKFDARWRELHFRLDETEKLQRERRERARHNDVSETYQHYIDEWQSTLTIYTALREEIARAAPTTLEGHLFKLALFIADQADGQRLTGSNGPIFARR
jgi:hypothetical protein